MTPSAETLKQRLAANPTVGLIGLGYVGLPLAVAFAESGATVIGVDLDARRVTAVRAGESFIEDVPAERLARLVRAGRLSASDDVGVLRSEEHTSELQSPDHLVCRLLLEKKKKKQ